MLTDLLTHRLLLGLLQIHIQDVCIIELKRSIDQKKQVDQIILDFSKDLTLWRITN